MEKQTQSAAFKLIDACTTIQEVWYAFNGLDQDLQDNALVLLAKDIKIKSLES
jgi:hypothetical protein